MTVRCLVWHICLTRFLLGPRHFITPSTSVPGTCILPLMLSGPAAGLISCRRPLRKIFLFTRLVACPCLKTLSCVAPATCAKLTKLRVKPTFSCSHCPALHCTCTALLHLFLSASASALSLSHIYTVVSHLFVPLCLFSLYTPPDSSLSARRKSLTPLSNTFQGLL